MLGRPSAKPGVFSKLVFALGLPALLVLVASPADARIRHHHHSGHAVAMPAGATDPNKDAALIIDGETGKVLYARSPDATRHPASLTKMMTLYLLFDAMQKGQMTLSTPMTVSRHASVQSPTKLYLKPGDSITVDQAIKAIVVRSANDVAVTIAEALGGTELGFAGMMNAKARQLGMTGTFYHNASGLPDPQQISTARDLALLARHLAYDFPQYFHYFSTPAFTFRGVTYQTHDNLIGRYNGADGIKTGYTGASGFNLVSSVVRDRVHLIGVVMGGRTAHRRDNEMMNLLDTAFAQVQQNPTLVARADIPWQHVTDGTVSNPVVAGFEIPGMTPHLLQQPAAQPAATASLAPQAGVPDYSDEDAAETADDEEDDSADSAAKPAATAPAQQPRQHIVIMQQLPKPDVVATAKPTVAPALIAQRAPFQPTPAPVAAAKPAAPMIAALQPKPAPALRLASIEPVAKVAVKSAVPQQITAPDARAWTIQIGAFANTATARAQLSSYAEKSMDVLGTAGRMIVPFQSIGGHTLYRARFGLFVEREAREICTRLTQRGQTCFAALASR